LYRHPLVDINNINVPWQTDSGGAPGALPPKIGKDVIFLRKMVIFHTKYPKNFRVANCRNLTDGRTDIKCLSNGRKNLITLKDQAKIMYQSSREILWYYLHKKVWSYPLYGYVYIIYIYQWMSVQFFYTFLAKNSDYNLFVINYNIPTRIFTDLYLKSKRQHFRVWNMKLQNFEFKNYLNHYLKRSDHFLGTLKFLHTVSVSSSDSLVISYPKMLPFTFQVKISKNTRWYIVH
jgi:hypothetical protein